MHSMQLVHIVSMFTIVISFICCNKLVDKSEVRIQCLNQCFLWLYLCVNLFMVIMNTKYLTIPWDLLWFAHEIGSFLVFAMVKLLSYSL